MSVAVVVASFRSTDLLAMCLESVLPQACAHGAPVIVARPPGAPTTSLRTRFPDVHFVTATADDIPRLRGAGLAATSHDLVVVTEDHCVADVNWLATLTKTYHATGADVIGGGMGNARRTSLVDWGAFFAEYGFFSWARPHDDRQPPLITGANVAYARCVLPDVTAWTLGGVWENVCHDRLHSLGRRLLFSPDARVLQNGTYKFGAFCLDRYEHGRDYARTRLSEGRAAARWQRLAMTPLLVPILTARVARAAAGVSPTAFACALPLTMAFLAAWSGGEAVGYAKGPAR